MKKAFPYIAAIGVGLVALYAVYHFRSTRLLPQQLDEMRQANERLENVEQAEGSGAASHEHDGHDHSVSDHSETAHKAATDGQFKEVPEEQLSDEVPDVFLVTFETSEGPFVVEVHRDWAPNGAQRFYDLVNIGFYDDIRVFRVVPGFVVQFGISNDPQLNETWMESTIPDDPVAQSNTRGTLTFAAASNPNSRSTQVFINLASNAASLDSRGFAPIGEVIQGMDIVDQFYSGYGESITQLQPQIASAGNAYLDGQFPNLTVIKRAYVVEPIGEPSAENGEGATAPDNTEPSEPSEPESNQ